MNPLPSATLGCQPEQSRSVCGMAAGYMEPVGLGGAGQRGHWLPGHLCFTKAVWGVELEGWTLLPAGGHPGLWTMSIKLTEESV